MASNSAMTTPVAINVIGAAWPIRYRSCDQELHGRAPRLGRMGQDKLYDEATKVTAEDGEVILDGPDDVDIKVTPEAAEETAENLVDGAVMARGQRRLRNLPHKPH
jgi:hypothetical protein